MLSDSVELTPSVDPIASFFDDLMRYRAWNEDMLKRGMATLAICAAKPRGSSHDANLYQDEVGNVWRVFGSCAERLERVGGPFSRYTVVATINFTPDDRIVGQGSLVEIKGEVKFVKRSMNCMAEDWGWTNPAPYGSSTFSYYTTSIARDVASIAFVDAILAQRPAVESWFRTYALMNDRTLRESIDGDWPTLVRMFAPAFKEDGRDVNDNGSLLCNLHAAIDELAGHKGIRAYMH
ncbi:MAG: hypothetical protein NUV56_04565 [Candidatus Uhrbacteria bacterium]|nr:hypothetical protein [Candidatus Uhrbacteria bacterium]